VNRTRISGSTSDTRSRRSAKRRPPIFGLYTVLKPKRTKPVEQKTPNPARTRQLRTRQLRTRGWPTRHTTFACVRRRRVHGVRADLLGCGQISVAVDVLSKKRHLLHATIRQSSHFIEYRVYRTTPFTTSRKWHDTVATHVVAPPHNRATKK